VPHVRLIAFRIAEPVNRHGHIALERLSGEAESLIVKERVAAAGIDPAGLSGRSLRADFATSAVRAGVSPLKIRGQTGHASDAMLSRYVRDGEAARQQSIKPVNDRLDEIKPKNLDKSLRPHGHEPPRTDNQHRDRRSPHLLLMGAVGAVAVDPLTSLRPGCRSFRGILAQSRAKPRTMTPALPPTPRTPQALH
jgi:hypothetical protein